MLVGTCCKKYISKFTWIVTHSCLHYVCSGARFHYPETLNIIFQNTYVSDLRDKLQRVCWEQGIWVVFPKAHPTIVIWCVSIRHFQK